MKLHSVSFWRLSKPLPEGPATGGNVLDMLRYDFAFVKVDDQSLIALPRFKVPGSGTVGNALPTLGRWVSFGRQVQVCPSSVSILELREAFTGDAWVTYQHPRTDEFGAADYRRYVAFTIGQYLAAKTVVDAEREPT